MSGNASIQRLLKAESEANAKIASARQTDPNSEKDKQNLLKKARDDADLEVRAYKEKKEMEFEDYKKSHEEDTGSHEQMLQKETQSSIDEINQQVAANKDKVMELILKTIADVHIEENKEEEEATE